MQALPMLLEDAQTISFGPDIPKLNAFSSRLQYVALKLVIRKAWNCGK